MKKKNWLLMIGVISVVGFSTSCNNDSEVPQDPTPANVLCDGNGSTSFFPLAADNVWTYSGVTTTTKTVTNVETVGGEQQFTVNVHGLNTYTEVYNVGANGDVFFHSPGDSGLDSTYLYVPANPTLNQEWSYTISFDGHIRRKITSLTATITTSHCTYENCVEVKSYDGTGDYLYAHYYKEGVGLVKIDYGLTTDNVLTSVTLN
ncbi:MAG: hypothetical protein GC178_13175 [Flavobacteriales bacterium]|nr:hypothetical protein [Flavobacteriales bacterium]